MGQRLRASTTIAQRLTR